MIKEYRSWTIEKSYRRQVVFSKENEPSFFFCDFENMPWDSDLSWVNRCEKTIKQKIDSHLDGSFNDYDCEKLGCLLIDYNLKCHIKNLNNMAEMTTSEAENKWNLAEGTVRAALSRGVISGRKSNNTWLVTKYTMTNHYGNLDIIQGNE